MGLFSFGGTPSDQCVHHNEKTKISGYLIFPIIGLIVFTLLGYLYQKYGSVEWLDKNTSLEDFHLSMNILSVIFVSAIVGVMGFIYRSSQNRFALGTKITHNDEVAFKSQIKVKLQSGISKNESLELEAYGNKLELGLLKVKELKKLKKLLK